MSIKVVNPVIVENKLPRVTDEDNGKTLVVEQGEWTASESTGGGAKSWNDLEDKPFYEEVVHLGDTLTWDGQPTDVSIEYGGLRVYRVSSNTPNMDKWIGATISISTESEAITITEDDVFEMADSVYVVAEIIIVATADNTVVEADEGVYVTIPHKGIYCINFDNIYMTSCSIPNYEFTNTIITPLDSKYLPELFKHVIPNQVLYDNTVTADGFYVRDENLLSVCYSLEYNKPYTVNWNGTEYQLTKVYGPLFWYFGNASLVFSAEDTGEPFVCYGVSRDEPVFHVSESEKDKSHSIKIIGDLVTYDQIEKGALGNALAYYTTYNFDNPWGDLDDFYNARDALREGRKVYGKYNNNTVEVIAIYEVDWDMPNFHSFSLSTLDHSTIYDWNYDAETGTVNFDSIDTKKYTVRKVGNKSWEDIENRPFGEEFISGDTLTWDGIINEDDVTFADFNYGDYYKISDFTPTLEGVQLGGKIVLNSGETYNISSENIVSHGNYIDIQSKAIIIALEDGIAFSQTTIPQKGIYFNYASTYYVSSLTLNGFSFTETKIHKIDEKYLPDGTGTKIIDLTKYIADNGNSFNTAILLLFASGGGSLDVPCTTTFWEDVNTTKPIKLKLDASALVDGATIYSDATAMVCQDYGVSFFSTTYAMYEPNSQVHIRTTVMFERYTDKIRISLVLEPLTIPNRTTE